MSITLTIKNNSGYSGDHIFWCLLGNNSATYMNAQGELVPPPADLNKIWFRLSEKSSGALPAALGCRMMFNFVPTSSSEQDLPEPDLSLNNIGGTINVDGYVDKDGDPNYATVFDKFEFSNSDSLWINTTKVDFFSIPMTIIVKEPGGNKSAGALIPNGRNQIFSQVKADSNFGQCIVTSDTPLNGSTNVRVMSPLQYGPGLALDWMNSFWDSYVNDVWKYFGTSTQNTLTVDYDQKKWTGKVQEDGLFHFSGESDEQVAKPTSMNVFMCDGPFQGGQGLHSDLTRVIGAAFNRSVLPTESITGSSTQPDCNKDDFYKNAPIHMYAKVIHANSKDGIAYAFSYDDICNLYSSSIISTNATELELDLASWK